MNKRILLLAAVVLALLIPSAALVGQAGAANPHGPPGDPNGSCGGSNGKKPSDCNNPGLPQSDGCQHGQAPNKNPHCQPGTTPTTPTTPTNPSNGVGGGQNQSQGSNETPGGGGGSSSQQGINSAPTEVGPTSTLPYTGVDGRPLALMGLMLIGAGFMLRRRLV